MKALISMLAILGFVRMSSAAESISEKAEVTAKTVRRAAKRGSHRTAEAICGKLTGDNKVQCLAKEAKNRLEDGKDVLVDKTSEVKNSVDGNKK